MRFIRKSQRRQTRSGTRFFFATDVHGSDRCFRKFLNAASFYDVNVLVLGGDITGKVLIPVELTSGGWQVRFQDNLYRDLTDSGLAELELRIQDLGMYPIRGSREELRALEEPSQRERLFVAAVVKQMARWIDLAERRLAGTGVRCMVAPGNDDPWAIDDVLQQSTVIEFAEGRCLQLDDGTEVITTGYSNQTPWHTPREVSEDELAQRLERMFREVQNPSSMVLVAHPPPRDTELDQAPKIDDDFRIEMDVGALRMTSVGSAAVRLFITEHQPMLGLHGHVHESKGIQRLGRTVCVNPGSEYRDGVLCGSIVSVRGSDVVSCQLVTG